MLNGFIRKTCDGMVPIKPIITARFESWRRDQPEYLKHWMSANRFNAEAGSICSVPNAQGELALILIGMASEDDFWVFGDLPLRLPNGTYFFDPDSSIWPRHEQWQRALMAWGLGNYRFSRYQKEALKTPQPQPQIFIPESANADFCEELVRTLYWVRDLINTPTEDLSPDVLADIAQQFAKEYRGEATVIRGDALKAAGYPAIHAVGRASERPPCLIEMRWRNPGKPSVTLVGKGICFDSGGINLKTSEGMRLMKKDMAGAAHALGLARLIVTQKLPVNLRVLIPAAENMVAGNSYRPGDVIVTRAGISVEVSNTDAEGRLVLCDALSAAVEESPNVLIDFSTLTGAARVALGPDIPAFFSNNEALAKNLLQASEETSDPLWRLPLYSAYERYLKSNIADIVNASEGGYAGAITAALYLKRFVPNAIPWVHFDMSAWNYDRLPGRPVGGEALALRAVYRYLETGRVS